MNRILIIVGLLFVSCGKKLPVIAPDVITEKTLHDTDDPAIWINKNDASKSIVFGTDKNTDGAIYAFNLEGKIIEEKTIRNLKRPNNVDLEYLDVNNNSLTSMDVTNLTALESLIVDYNQLSTIDLSNNVLLETFSFRNNNFLSLDFSGLANLTLINSLQGNSNLASMAMLHDGEYRFYMQNLWESNMPPNPGNKTAGQLGHW